MHLRIIDQLHAAIEHGMMLGADVAYIYSRILARYVLARI